MGFMKLAKRMETLATEAPVTERPPEVGVIPATKAAIVAKVRRILRFRDLRRDIFKEDLFADPAWDMLLEIFICELQQQRISVSSACASSRVPPTTGLRWLNVLENKGLIRRSSDPFDGRRIHVSLTDEAFTKMRVLVESREFEVI